MTNYAFRYTESESHISSENIECLRKIAELPLEEAIELVDNDLAEDEDLGINE